MKKIIATLRKEWLLLKRDIAGLMLLLLMPAVLIIVMALIQDAPFRDYQELRFELLLADEDGGSLAKEIKEGLQSSKNFIVLDSFKREKVSEKTLKEMLRKGSYQVGIVIPKGATAEMVNGANLLANSISKKLGLGTLPARASRDSIFVKMYFDPVAKPTFRASISFALDRFITLACSNFLVKRLGTLNKSMADSSSDDKNDFKTAFKGIGIREEAIYETQMPKAQINSVQHNVPAWAIFGMFFIVVPIAGHMIRERQDGSALRVALIPNAGRFASWGRILFYTFICTIQFWIMMAIGIWLLPQFGLPALSLGTNGWLLIPVSLSIAFAATAYGNLCGSLFKTTNQAMPFGAISIVILSAIGGLWVPVELLPKPLQAAASVSPLHWSLKAVQTVTLRAGGVLDLLPELVSLLLLGLLFCFLSRIKVGEKEGQ